MGSYIEKGKPMNLYRIEFEGTAYVTADNELEAEEKFSAGDWKDQSTDVKEVELVDEELLKGLW